MSVGRSTLLRMIRALPDPPVGQVTVLGVESSRCAAATSTARC
jgi:ABC-type methionine transport system ATPase subunit